MHPMNSYWGITIHKNFNQQLHNTKICNCKKNLSLKRLNWQWSQPLECVAKVVRKVCIQYKSKLIDSYWDITIWKTSTKTGHTQTTEEWTAMSSPLSSWVDKNTVEMSKYFYKSQQHQTTITICLCKDRNYNF